MTLRWPSDSALSLYIERLHFASDHISSDQRPLDPRGLLHELARIEPEASPIPARLPPGGRIVARIVNLGDAVRRFALAPRGVTYVWVQDDRSPGYAIYISTSRGRIIRREQARLLPSVNHPTKFPLIPLARFVSNFAPDSTLQETYAMAQVAGICTSRCKTPPWCSIDSLWVPQAR